MALCKNIKIILFLVWFEKILLKHCYPQFVKLHRHIEVTYMRDFLCSKKGKVFENATPVKLGCGNSALTTKSYPFLTGVWQKKICSYYFWHDSIHQKKKIKLLHYYCIYKNPTAHFFELRSLSHNQFFTTILCIVKSDSVVTTLTKW